LLFAASGCQKANESLVGSSVPRRLKVETVRVKKVDNVVSTPVYFGVMQPKQQANLTFSKQGTIAKINVEIGQQVRKGDVLAELSQQQLLQQRDELQRQLADAAVSAAGPATNTLQQVNNDIARGVIAAPFDGIVAEFDSFEGAIVSPGQTVIHVYDQSSPNLEFDFPAGIASKIDPANMWQIDINGEPVLTRVRFKSPMQKSGGNVRIAFVSEKPMQSTWTFVKV